MIPVLTSTTEKITVGVASAAFNLILLDGVVYQFVSSTACWIKLAAAPVASAATGSTYVPANTPVYVISSKGDNKLAVIQDAAGGNATLTMCIG